MPKPGRAFFTDVLKAEASGGVVLMSAPLLSGIAGVLVLAI